MIRDIPLKKECDDCKKCIRARNALQGLHQAGLPPPPTNALRAAYGLADALLGLPLIRLADGAARCTRCSIKCIRCDA